MARLLRCFTSVLESYVVCIQDTKNQYKLRNINRILIHYFTLGLRINMFIWMDLS